MKTTNASSVELIDHMGTDITVVNAARVSFDKTSDYKIIGWKEHVDIEARTIYQEPIKQLKESDERLISYLAKHNHWSPFAHTSIQLRLSAPVFVARQLVKHQVGGVWNEVSRRYVDDEPVFYVPDVWRKRAENKKQGSSEEAADVPPSYIESRIELLNATYKQLIEEGVAPEQARMILPQNMMTSWYWTGSLMFFYRVWKERTNAHAQMETQEVAKQIGTICEQLFPVSWAALIAASSDR